jgi:hypothetical protein
MNVTLAGLLLGGVVVGGTWLASKLHLAFAVVVCIFFLLPLAIYLFMANIVSETVVSIAKNTDWGKRDNIWGKIDNVWGRGDAVYGSLTADDIRKIQLQANNPDYKVVNHDVIKIA